MAAPARTGALILAAGKGTRMHSRRPKVLQNLLGESMLRHVVRALSPLFQDALWAVVGHEAEMVRKDIHDLPVRCIEQTDQLGTGHALITALPELQAAGITRLVVVNGDTPLVTTRAIRWFMDQAAGSDLALATLMLPDPAAFGRVVRADGQVKAVIEARDYDPSIHGPVTGEINAGLYWLNLEAVAPLVRRLTCANQSGEYYLTDLVELAVVASLPVAGVACRDTALLGVNTPQELAQAEETLRRIVVERHLAAGVIMHAPELIRISPEASIAPGANLTGPCEIVGASEISRDAVIDSHCVIINSTVQEGARIRHFSHLDEAAVGPDAVVGPYARLRPGAVLEKAAQAGNFVEMKQATLGQGAKANHLTYLGDAEVGPGANIGAGTITCNYDGVNKHRTVIGAGAFIGSNSALIAPVSVGDRAVIGAGSAIAKPVPEDHLGVTRAPQKSIPLRKTTRDRS